MTSAVGKRVRKLERIEEIMEGQIYLISIPPGWDAKEAIEHVGIEPKGNDLVIEAVWLGDVTEPTLIKSEKPKTPYQGNDYIPGEAA